MDVDPQNAGVQAFLSGAFADKALHTMSHGVLIALAEDGTKRCSASTLVCLHHQCTYSSTYLPRYLDI